MEIIEKVEKVRRLTASQIATDLVGEAVQELVREAQLKGIAIHLINVAQETDGWTIDLWGEDD